jgi:hypothetical protein
MAVVRKERSFAASNLIVFDWIVSVRAAKVEASFGLDS